MNEEFKGIMLEDSWVLSWVRFNDSLVFDVEFSLWPEHPQYENPKANEWTCYKRGKLIFEGISSIQGLLDIELVTPTVDPDDEHDYGNIEHLEELASGEFAVVGDFGDVRIRCRNVRIQIDA